MPRRTRYNFKTRNGVSPARRRNLKTRTKSISLLQGLKQNIGYEPRTGEDNIITRTTKKP